MPMIWVFVNVVGAGPATAVEVAEADGSVAVAEGCAEPAMVAMVVMMLVDMVIVVAGATRAMLDIVVCMIKVAVIVPCVFGKALF